MKKSLTGRPVHLDMWRLLEQTDIAHIALARRADVMVIAPATANMIGKIACGLADDLISTMVVSSASPVLLAPAMNSRMWENPVVAQNVDRLRELGYGFVGPEHENVRMSYVIHGPQEDASFAEEDWKRLTNPVKVRIVEQG